MDRASLSMQPRIQWPVQFPRPPLAERLASTCVLSEFQHYARNRAEDCQVVWCVCFDALLDNPSVATDAFCEQSKMTPDISASGLRSYEFHLSISRSVATALSRGSLGGSSRRCP